MAKQNKSFRYTKKVPTVTVKKNLGKDEKTGDVKIEEKTGQALFPFGKQCSPIFEEDLTDSVAAYLMGKKE